MKYPDSGVTATAASIAAACQTKDSTSEPMTPFFLNAVKRIEEISDVVTLEFDTDGLPPDQWSGFKPGQFNMLYAFGVGEVAISISGDAGDTQRIVHTVRAVGAGSRALVNLECGSPVGLRGPYGQAWPVEQAIGKDVLVIAGGLGLAPLRPVLYHLMQHREDYGNIALLYGARSPKEILFHQELKQWQKQANVTIHTTVDHADRTWTGHVGLVTRLLPEIDMDPINTSALLCGPEIMMRACATDLIHQGYNARQIFLSMERNMKCAVGFCGHCQYGPHFICKDGPVFTFDNIQALLGIREI